MKKSNSKTELKNKLILYRSVSIVAVTILLIKLSVITDTPTNRFSVSLVLFALLVALPLTMLFDDYLVRIAKGRPK